MISKNFHHKINRRIFFSLFLIFFLIVLDQLTKIWARTCLMGQEDRILIQNVLQFHYLENTGAAFSILRGNVLPLTILTCIICILLIYILVKIPNEKKYILLNMDIVLLIAGALGNLIDRVSNQYVIDFIYFSLIDFPVFNVADIYVTVSIFLLIILILFYYKEEDLTFLNPKSDFSDKES